MISVSKKSVRWFIFLFFFVLPVFGVTSEILGLENEKKGEEIGGRNQSPEQVEAFASGKSKNSDPQSNRESTTFRLQKRLKELGYYPGSIDGIWGKQTEIALQEFQKHNSLSVTGKIDSQTRHKLGLMAIEPKVQKKEPAGAIKGTQEDHRISAVGKLDAATRNGLSLTAAGPAFRLFLLGSLLTMALFHLLLFGLHRKEIITLYFACLCVLTAFLYMMSVEKFFFDLFPHIDRAIAVKIEYLCAYLGFTILMIFIRKLYAKEFSKTILRVSQILFLGFALQILLPNIEAQIRAYVMMASGVMVFVFCLYLIYILIRAGLRRREGAILSLVGFFCLFTTIINDILYDQSIIYFGRLAHFGIFIFIFAQASILYLRFSKSSNRVVVYERFVPKHFLKNLDKEDIVDVKLGDNAQLTMSVLFSDIRNFTTLSEKMTPEENFKFINSYLGVMGPVIRRHKGFIDKYIGDAIMALFSNNADDAVEGAIGMLRKLVEYNAGRKRAGYVPIQIGIGINTGILRIGIVGEHGRIEGTAIGDTVNIASRIEELTKMYGVSLLISDQTYNRLENPKKYHIRKIDREKIRGKAEPVTVWEVFDADPPDVLKYKLDTAAMFEDARSLYQSKRFEEANEMFLDCLARNPRDKTAEVYRERCKLYMKMGVDENWEGIARHITYERAPGILSPG